MAVLADDMERMSALLTEVRRRIKLAFATQPVNGAVSLKTEAEKQSSDQDESEVSFPNAEPGRARFEWLEAYAPPLRRDDKNEESRRRRFDGISSAYAMRRFANPPGLQRGLSASHWTGLGPDRGVSDEADLEAVRAREETEQRARWVVEQMQLRETEFTNPEHIK